MPRKILIVDDDPHALRLVSYAFEAEGYQVAVASSGAEALARLASERPDLVVLDVMMPDMSGLEVCQRIRANPATARLPILMLSARGLVADRVSGLRSGADDYLAKPADTSELLARAEALLARAAYPPARTGRVLAFLGAKGGVGTTTVAVNVGALLATGGYSVALVELRPGYGTARALLRLDPETDLGGLLAKAPGEITPQEVESRLVRHASGLRLLAAPRVAASWSPASHEVVDALLPILAGGYDYVVLDLDHSWSALNRAAVDHAHFTAVVSEPEQVSLQCARATLTTLRAWGIMGDLAGVVIVNRGTTSIPPTLPQIRQALSAEAVGAVPPAGDACAQAVRDGVPLSLLQPQHVASAAMRELARVLSGTAHPPR
ncbi:MAG: response regulator [Anaerolineae bacterium]|nr:response regulator [Anaerolineae bacterium]